MYLYYAITRTTTTTTTAITAVRCCADCARSLCWKNKSRWQWTKSDGTSIFHYYDGVSYL